MDVVNRPPGLGSISFLTGPLAGSVFQISKPEMTLGREPTNDIVISDPSVSRRHARLIHNGGHWSIEKLAMQNIVTVNQRDVQQAVISDRDTIGLGTGTTFLLLVSSPQISSEQRAAGPSAPQSPPREQLQPTPRQPLQAPPLVLPSGGQPPASQPPFTEPVSAQLSPHTVRAPADLYPPGASKTAPGTVGIPSLEISSNIHADKQSFPLTKQVINIGRDPSNDIVINELVVSGFHAQIVREGKQLVLIHPHPARAKTLNGLLYQGRHIKGDEQFRKPLARGDFFRIGDEHGTLVTLAYDDGSGALQDIVPEVRPITLGAPVITIGREADNMVVLNHPLVSRYHARLVQVRDSYRIVDNESTNGIYVNDDTHRIKEALLKPGDEIRIGPFKLIYTGTELTQQDESKGIRIDALHLYKVGNKNAIL
ncbi:MAG TPA: FHA domain-containing protein, partial [Ktedonobacteraceae bacterium]|nr:FHA domain-containing protein [Ktedonobacteraceae bacterium]